MTVKMKRRGSPIEEGDITAFEERNGVKLPEDYRKFLLENNGGRPEMNAFDIPGSGGNEGGITDFLSIDEIQSTKKEFGDRFVANAWPIALAECGNYLCLVIGERVGVYFWDHELEADEGEPATWDNMFRVAEDFAGFWSALRPFDINSIEVNPDDVLHVWVNPDFKPKFD